MTALPYSAAAARNQAPILEVLREWLDGHALFVLEIGAGTGQHAVHFAGQFPQATWQPADRGDYLPGLRMSVAAYTGDNLRAPIELDVDEFPSVQTPDVMYTANTMHIMPWTSVRRMLRGAGERLPATGLFIVYGPFNVGGQFTSASNAHFDAALRLQQRHMGIRDREEVCIEADKAGMSLQRVYAMPANNQILVFERRAR